MANETSESWTLKLSSFVAGCCGVRRRKWLRALPLGASPRLQPPDKGRNNEDCRRVDWGWVVMPLTRSSPNGAEHASAGQRPGNQATHISAFSRNAAERRITHPRPDDAAPERCGAPSERIRTHHPCPGFRPIIQPPRLHPRLVCFDPLGQEQCGRSPITHLPDETIEALRKLRHPVARR